MNGSEWHLLRWRIDSEVYCTVPRLRDYHGTGNFELEDAAAKIDIAAIVGGIDIWEEGVGRWMLGEH